MPVSWTKNTSCVEIRRFSSVPFRLLSLTSFKLLLGLTRKELNFFHHRMENSAVVMENFRSNRVPQILVLVCFYEFKFIKKIIQNVSKTGNFHRNLHQYDTIFRQSTKFPNLKLLHHDSRQSILQPRNLGPRIRHAWQRRNLEMFDPVIRR